MKTKSFTLIELLVVIVIIGILAGVIIVSTSSSISKANIAKVKVFENSIQNELGANMVSRWKLDEIIGTTTTPDAWGSNTGTLTNGPVLKSEAECVTGKCMYFDGLNDYIDLGNSSILKPIDAITVSVWLNPTSVNDGNIHDAIDSHEGYEIQERNTGYWNWYVYLNDLQWHLLSTGANTAIAKKWQHVVGTYDSKTGKQAVYLNGELKNNVIISGNQKITYSSANVMIGDVNYHGRYFKGLIDDVCIYNGAISSSQIKQNYITGLNSLLSNGSISKEEYNERINSLALHDD